MSAGYLVYGKLWKEYALSDSRYLTSDFFVLSVECITVVSFLDSLFTATKRPLPPITTTPPKTFFFHFRSPIPKFSLFISNIELDLG